MGRAELGETTVVEPDTDPRPLVAELIDDGGLYRALVLIHQEGRFGRIVVFPRRGTGPPTIAELQREDHRRLDDLADQACRLLAMDPLRAVAKAHELSIGLRRHGAAEEAILFPPYEAEFGLTRTSATAVVEREHRGIHHYLDRIVAAAEAVAGAKPQDHGIAIAEVLRLMKALGTLLEVHMEKEEHAMFPQLDQHLDEAARNEILRRLVLF